MIGIYCFQNKINGHRYIGKSVDIQRRYREHKHDSLIEDFPIYRAIRKYGWDNFEFTIIEECSLELLDEREVYWIRYYDTYYHGYNATFGGEGSCGHGRLVYQYDKDGYFIKEFPTLSAAARESHTQESHISSVCYGKRSSAGDYQWRFFKQDRIDSYHAWDCQHHSICQFDLNGVYITTFISLKDAGKSIGIINTGNLSRCAKSNKINSTHSAYGFIWRYLEDC